MASKKQRAATPALHYLKEHGIEHETHSFDPGSDHFGEHAVHQLSQELHCQPEQVFKTLIVDLSAAKGSKRRLATACIPVPSLLNLKKLAHALQVPKITMAEAADAKRSTGYIPGGISPIAQKTPLPTVIDTSAEQWEHIYISGGKRGLDIKIAPADLAQATRAIFAEVADQAQARGRR